MDRTALFKASVKTIRTRNKALGLKDSGSSILNQKTKRTGYGAKARDVLNNISKLKTFLLEHRKDYIDSFCHLSSEVSNMTDIERDQIDNDAQMYMRTCSSAIRTLKTEASQQSGTDQGSVHREAVVELLEDYLKVVVRLYSEQRAIRVKRAVDRKRMSRLQPEHKRVKQDKPTVPSSVLGKASSRESSREEVAIPAVAMPLDPLTSAEDDITPEEAQMFEQENKKLFEEMNNLVDEVRQIEGKVVEISRLQEIFSEKVIQQSNQIDRLYDTAVHTTENVQEGNEQIRKAIKNNATFRVWILFFLIMCSFSLLFLDWYS